MVHFGSINKHSIHIFPQLPQFGFEPKQSSFIQWIGQESQAMTVAKAYSTMQPHIDEMNISLNMKISFSAHSSEMKN